MQPETILNEVALSIRLAACLTGSAILAISSAQAQTTLLPAAIALDPVIVTANRTSTPARAVGSAVTVIDRAELERRQVRFVADALRTIPGVGFSRTGTVGGLTQVRLRGAEGNQTLVLIDGIEVNDPATGGEYDFANLLADDVERIEVLRGPQSALYGSDAMGGVVNIVTRKGEGKPFATARLEGGSKGTASGVLSAGGVSGNADFFGSLGGYRTDGFSSASEWRGNPEADGYDNVTGFAKFGVDATQDLRLDMVGRVTDYRADADGFSDGLPADADAATRGRQMYGRAQARLDTLDGRWQHIAGISRSHTTLRYFTDGARTDTYVGDRTKVDYQSNVFLTQEAARLAHTLTFLAEHEEESADVKGEYSSFDRSTGQTGLVGQYQLGIADALFMTGAVRHDLNERFADSTTWRGTAAYDLSQTGTKLRGSYGTGIKNPTLFELFGYDGTYRGNPALKPEQAKGWDIGVDQWILDDALSLEATYFDQRITDLIQGAGNTSINLSGTSKIHGVELGLTAYLLDGLTLRAAYTFLDGEDANGVKLARRPENVASLDIGYSFLEGAAALNLGIVHTGGQQDIAFDAFYNQTRVELDSYTLVNLAGSYRFNEHAEAFARVENLFDERYEDVYGYGGMGRVAIAGVKLGF